MLITCQKKLDFGPSDQPAMDRRLSTYQFKSLANPTKRAATWLKKHPMECLIWATRKAQEAQHHETDEEDQSEIDEERSLYEDGALRQSEKEALQSVSLEEIMTENTAPVPVEDQDEQSDSEASDSQSDASHASDVLYALEEHLRGLQPDSLRHRQVLHMLQAEKDKRHRAEEDRKEQHKRRKTLLRTRGVSTQNAELISSNPEEPLPSAVTRELDRYEEKQRHAREHKRREVARIAFENAWLRVTNVWEKLPVITSEEDTAPEQGVG